jgi:hypothetical protein
MNTVYRNPDKRYSEGARHTVGDVGGGNQAYQDHSIHGPSLSQICPVKVNEARSLDDAHKLISFKMLLKYEHHFTATPGKCKHTEHEFKVTNSNLILGHSRPIPFALRPVVRAQIQQMLTYDITKYSDSSYLNPLMTYL